MKRVSFCSSGIDLFYAQILNSTHGPHVDLTPHMFYMMDLNDCAVMLNDLLVRLNDLVITYKL